MKKDVGEGGVTWWFQTQALPDENWTHQWERTLSDFDRSLARSLALHADMAAAHLAGSAGDRAEH